MRWHKAKPENTPAGAEWLASWEQWTAKRKAENAIPSDEAFRAFECLLNVAHEDAFLIPEDIDDHAILFVAMALLGMCYRAAIFGHEDHDCIQAPKNYDPVLRRVLGQALDLARTLDEADML